MESLMGVVREYGYDSGGLYLKRVSRDEKTTCYNTWIDVMQRCYSSKWKNKHNTYEEVTLCKEWHDYQNFALWFYNNYKVGFQIDKDILSDHYKIPIVYSPKTCRMVPRDINMLLVNRVGKSRNTELPLGVCNNSSGGYTAWCNNGKGKTINIGSTYCIDEARLLYKNFKEGLIQSKAEYYYRREEIDSILYKALMDYKVIN